MIHSSKVDARWSMEVGGGSSIPASRIRTSEGMAASVDYCESSEIQLLQVSKGAKRLTKMIDSWSRSPSLDEKTKDAAKGIVREAMELQESLVLLRKLQDAAKRMGGGGDVGDLGGSRRFPAAITLVENNGGVHCSTFGEPRVSSDGSVSRDCIEELRNVIKESLYKQKFGPSALDDGRLSSGRASSRSLGLNRMERMDERSNSVSSVSPYRETLGSERSSNLIAKLMGLEDNTNWISEKLGRREDEMLRRTSGWPLRATSDIEVPRAKKLQLARQSQDEQRPSLQAIIGSMQFKGLLRDGPMEVSGTSFYAPTASLMERRGKQVLEDDEPPPIVIMKPMKVLPQEKRDSHEDNRRSHKIGAKEDLDIGENVEDSSISSQREGKDGEKNSKVESSKKFKIFGSLKHKKDGLKLQKKLEDEKIPSLGEKENGRRRDLKAMKAVLSPVGFSASFSKLEKKLSKKLVKQEHKTSLPTGDSKTKHDSQDSTDYLKGKKFKGKRHVIECSSIHDNKRAGNSNAMKSTIDSSAISRASNSWPFHTSTDLPNQVIHEMNKWNRGTSSPDDVKRLLLSSQWFLSHAKEFVLAIPRQPIYYRRKSTLQDHEMRNARLYFGCAKELMARKLHLKQLSYNPFLALGIPRTFVSLDHFVGEFSSAFQKLEGYTGLADLDATSETKLNAKLEKDLLCKDFLISSVWDSGWWWGACVGDSDLVVGEMEVIILDQIVHELASDLLLLFR